MTYQDEVVIGGEISLISEIDGDCELTVPVDGQGDVVYVVEEATRPHYAGPYTVTPSASEQHLATAGLVMDYDVTVAPIPNNYGLITWNGSTLTVS